MSTLDQTHESRRFIPFGSVITVGVTLVGLIFVPTFAWRMQQANNKVAPLEGQVQELKTSASKYESALANERKKAGDLQNSKLALDDELTATKKTLGVTVDQVEVLAQESRQLTQELSRAKSELQRIVEESSRTEKELLAMQQLLEAPPGDAITALRERLKRLENAERQSAELRQKLASQRDSGWREPAARIMIPVEQTPATVMMTCPLPAELPTAFRLNPGESVLSSTPWYRVQTP